MIHFYKGYTQGFLLIYRSLIYVHVFHSLIGVCSVSLLFDIPRYMLESENYTFVKKNISDHRHIKSSNVKKHVRNFKKRVRAKGEYNNIFLVLSTM